MMKTMTDDNISRPDSGPPYPTQHCNLLRPAVFLSSQSSFFSKLRIPGLIVFLEWGGEGGGSVGFLSAIGFYEGYVHVIALPCCCFLGWDIVFCLQTCCSGKVKNR